MDSGGAESNSGLGVLFATKGTRSGPVTIDGRLVVKSNSCLFDNLCKAVGFDSVIDFFTMFYPIADKEASTFELDKISCPSNPKDDIANGDRSIPFHIKISKKGHVLNQKSSILLLCGPIRLENMVCPISEEVNFLKRICMEDFGIKVFQCPNSKTLYTHASYSYASEQVSYMTSVCEKDPHFYQSCGMIDPLTKTLGAVMFNDAALCDQFICSTETTVSPLKQRYKMISTNDACAQKSMSPQIMCKSDNDCQCLALPEGFCSAVNNTHVELRSGLIAPASRVCNGYCDVHYRCEDEAFCNGYLYGMYCKGYDSTVAYVKPGDICNGVPHYLCENDAEDEQNCPGLTSLSDFEKCNVSSHILHYSSSSVVPILNITRCSAPWNDPMNPGQWKLVSLCSNFLDQTNCSDSSRSAIVCPIGGYLSTVSKFFVCHGQSEAQSLCDNGIDQVCADIQVSLGCRLHKHQLCDGIKDCDDGTDENQAICHSLTVQTCTRAFKHDIALRIPLAWLRDGEEDCLNGIDEQDGWPSCGKGRTKRFVDSDDSSCGEVFLCSHQQAAFVQFKDLCDGIGSCGNEKRICDKSHSVIPTVDQTVDIKNLYGIEKLFFYCLPGLERLQKLAHKCVHKDISPIGANAFGIKNLTIFIPDKTINCDYTFGEIYTILSCAGYCEKKNSCPIRNKLKYNSCPGQHPNRIITIADNSFLTFVTKSQDGYKNNYFLCDNGFCIRYDQVCNLIDECGDGSDEGSCTNVFICSSNNQLRSISEKCDGKIDCSDLSDECNSKCGKRMIESWLLKLMCWTLGLLASILNIASIIRNVSQFNMEMSVEALNNKMYILLINVGDLIVGVYLLQIAVMDTIIFGNNYCIEQVRWISSFHCNLLGVISTVGHQTSLAAVTALSVSRAIGIRKGIITKEDKISRHSISSIAIKTASIITISFFGALVPLIPFFEDFFVNGMTYNPLVKLFIGSPGKVEHLNILQEYHGKFKNRDIKWRVISDLVDDMFSHDHLNNAIGRKKLEFYGNDGVCLFKFFVKTDDPQRIYVWLVITLNTVFLGILSAGYILINLFAKKNSRALIKEETPLGEKLRERNQKLQRKISMIIVTDLLCWLPLTIVSCLHSSDVINASPYYPIISIVFLPINSLVNPVLYNEIFTQRIHGLLETLANKAKRIKGRVISYFPTLQPPGL